MKRIPVFAFLLFSFLDYTNSVTKKNKSLIIFNLKVVNSVAEFLKAMFINTKALQEA